MECQEQSINSSMSELEEKLTKITTMLDNQGYQDMCQFNDDINNIAKHSLVDSDIGFWCLNQKTKQLFFSKNWKEFLGYSKVDIKELTLEELSKHAHYKDLSKFNNFINQIYSDSSYKGTYELL